MSKELEAYFKIDHTLCLNSQNIKFGIDEDEHIDCQNIDEAVNCLETIKEALERLESIDNSNPSEAFMKLNLLLDRANHDEILSRKSTEFCEKWLKEIQEAYDTIKQALLKAQELEKENELLKEIIKRY